MDIETALIVVGRTPGSSSRSLQREAECGRLRRLARGVYVETAFWNGLSALERHLLAVRVVRERDPDAVFCHRSAAIVHGLPVIGVPARPEVLHRPGVRSGGSVGAQRRSTAAPAVPVRIGGLAVVPLARTLLDLAATLPFREALVPLDEALRSGADVEVLRGLLLALPSRGSRRALLAVDHADARSASAGESLSRGTLLELGFPLPLLQVPVVGLAYSTDFGWPGFRVRGEFDGLAKYREQRYLRGATSADSVIAEKRREDAIRAATGDRFARWTWDDALRVHPLRRILLDAGLPQTSWPTNGVR